MSRENVEAVRRHIEAWNRRDLATWMASYSPDAEIDWSRARGPFKGVYRGPREREAFWEVFWSTFDDVQVELYGLAEAGSEVVYSNTAHMRGREGIEVSARSTFVYTIENGQITRFRMFQARAEALEAVGLAERAMSDRDEKIVERLRRGYEAFNRGDYDSAMEMIAADPEIEFARPGGQPPITGAEALRGWMEPDAFEENIIEPLDFRMRGDKVLVRIHVRARGAGSGIEMAAGGWNVWTLSDDGLMTRVEVFSGHQEAEALEAAGLSE
jgi:ketosteroid isomerase-like protein